MTPINYTDPTGHWVEKIHHEMTKKALQKSKHKKLNLKHLQYGSALPDKLDKYSGRYWHGHTKSNVHQDFLNKGIATYRKKTAKSKKSKDSLILLGTYLHSVQDRFAHAYLNAKGDLDNLVKNLSAAERRYHEDYILKKTANLPK